VPPEGTEKRRKRRKAPPVSEEPEQGAQDEPDAPVEPEETEQDIQDESDREIAEEELPPDPSVDKLSVVEALLFVSPEPLSVAMISEVTGFDQGAVREMVNDLMDSYLERGGGLVIREVGGGFGFFATPPAAPYISRLIRSQFNPRLTRAALETLAIVAYLQPVSRGLVAEIRGVQSEGVMKTLEERGLVREVGKGGPPGYPALFGTTVRFLERFGLNSIDDLPSLEKFAPDDATVEKIKRSLSWELLEGESVEGRITKGRENTEDTVERGRSLTESRRGSDSPGEGDG
jgi:segregation and condensation protein B